MLVTEVGELTREVLHLRSAYPSHGKPGIEEVKEGVGTERCDVFRYLCGLATTLGIDLEQCFAKKIGVNKQRDWKASTGSRRQR